MQQSDLSDDLRDLASLTRDIAEHKISPLIEETEERATFSPEIQQILADAGFFGLVVPEDYGGTESDIGYQCIVLEELARVYPSACTYLTAHWLATKLIALHATGDGEAEWVRPLLQAAAAGQMLGAIAVTEPDHGSDLGSITTKARKDGESWIINGTKRFITNGGFADFYTVLARTGGPGPRGLSLFAVEADRAGVVAARWEKKMGLHGSATAEMQFDDVRSACRPPHRRLRARIQLPDARIRRGAARRCSDVSGHFAGCARRRDPLCRRTQTIRQGDRRLPRGAVPHRRHGDRRIHLASQWFTTRYAPSPSSIQMRHGWRRSPRPMRPMSAMSVASAGVQVHGGAGYVRDFPVEMLMRDAKINQIYEGTNQILRMVIARTYFGELAR